MEPLFYPFSDSLLEANVAHLDVTSLPDTARRQAEWSELSRGPTFHASTGTE